MTTDPTAQAAFRVPRSEVDSLYVPGEQAPASLAGVGTIVSVDSSNLCTVLVTDDEISGVMWLGLVPPRVGDVVELEMRGDLLVVPASNDLDTFLEGQETNVAHIVSDTDPGTPPAEELQVGGSMRSLDAWFFYGADTTNWSRELSASGQGLRLFQPAPPVMVARNMATNPSGEAGVGPDENGKSWTGTETQSGTYSGTALAASTTERAYNGSVAFQATWLANAKPSGVTLRVPGHAIGAQYTAQIWVWVPTGGQDVRLVVQGVAAGTATTVKGSWTQLTLTYTATAAEQIIGITTPAGAATLAGLTYFDALSVISGAVPLAEYFDGATIDTPTDQYVWRGDAGLSASEHYSGAMTPKVLIARNLVLNPSMETPNGPVPKGIAFSANAQGASDTTWKSSGVTSLRVEPTPTGSNDSWAYVQGTSTSANTTNILQPGKTYTIIATSRLGPALTGALHANARKIQVSHNTVAGFTGSTPNYSGGMPNVANTVVTQRLTITIPATAMWATLRLGCGAPAGGGAVWWDDVCVVEDTYSGDYFDGSTPAAGDALYSWTGTAHDSTSSREHYTGATTPSVLLRTNFLTNPSFETNTTGWIGTRATLSRQVLPGAPAGGAVARLVNDGSTNTHYLNTATPRYPVNPGQTVTFSAYARLISGSGVAYRARLFWFDAAGAVVGTGAISGPSVTLPADGSWVRLSVTATAPDLTVTVGPAVSTQSEANTDTWEVDAALGEFTTVVNPYFDGSTAATEDAYYRWEGTAHASTSTHWTAPPPVAPGPAGILWSEMTFDVNPADVLRLEMDLAEIDKDSTAQVYVLYGGLEGGSPLPGDLDTLQAGIGSAVALTAAISTLAANVPVPETVTLPVSGAVEPTTVRLGVRFVGSGTSQVLASAARATLTPKGWPLGSQWMNPSASAGALPTFVDTGVGTTSAITLPVGTVNSYIPIPGGAKKVVFTAPPDQGGVVEVVLALSVNVPAAAASTYLEFFWATGVATGFFGSVSRMNLPGLGTQPMFARGLLRVAAGETIEAIPHYRYSGANPATAFVYNRWSVDVLFHPGAVLAGSSSEAAPLSYWDGDSWRPSALVPATIDVTKDAATAPGTKTNTTTTCTRSASTLHEGTTLTLSSTVAPTTTGTVAFYRSTSTSGPWTSIGSSTLTAGKASKTWTTTPGAWYFKSTFVGSSTHNTSTSAVTAVTTIQKQVTRTVTLPCAWAQAYDGSGAKLSGTSHDTAVNQGNSNPAEGNRKSLLRFDHAAIPAPAEVTSVTLICRAGGWAHWYSPFGGGELVVGSFNNRPTVPAAWPGSDITPDRSRHTVGEGGWSVNLSSWANAPLGGSTFSGITIGPGAADSPLSYGYSSTPAKDQFTLKVTYTNWE